MRNMMLLSIIGGAVVFIVAVVLRLTNLAPLLNNPVVGLWRVSVVLLLLAIAIGIYKK